MADGGLDLTAKRVWVAGHRGMLGSAIVRRLEREGSRPLTTTRAQLDLTRQADVEDFFARERPEVVFLAAAKVGGIHANAVSPADFLADNLAIELNVIQAARAGGVEKLVFIGSSCIYPRLAAQPITEEALLTGPLEPTNEWYAIAKIAGLKLCQAIARQEGRDFISCMPTNLYGPYDNYDPKTSHVLAALIAKAHAAKVAGARTIEVWGSGTPLREFMHVDDCADAIVFLAKHYSGEAPINIASGDEVTIAELARMIAQATGLDADITLNPAYPDGTPRKRMDPSKLDAMGWTSRITLKDGLRLAYDSFRAERLERD